MRNLIITAFLLAISTFIQAQSFSFGPKAGVNISNYSGGNINSDARVGYHLGGLLSFGFGNAFSVQPEVLFSTQGAKVEQLGEKRDFKVSYLNVPVMLKVRLNNGFYIEAGPQAGFKMSENVPDETIEKFAKELDLSLAVGLGFQSNIGLGVGLRYMAGLSKVGNFSPREINPDFKNSVIQASVFWAIPVARK